MAAVSVTDGTLWYEDRGEGSPLVFVHGGWLNGDAWRKQTAHFADEHRVVTLDLRGHGRTGTTGRRRYSVDLFAEDLRRLLDYLDIDAPVLCGLSLGSMVVQSFLADHPSRAAGAILAGPVCTMPPVDVPAGAKALASPLPALSLSLSTAGPRATFRSMLGSIRAATGGPWLTVDADVRSWALDAVDDVTRAEYRKIFRALYAFSPPDLAGAGTPTLVVYGGREAAPVKRQGEAVAAAVADGRCLMVPGAGHLVNQDAPEAFNDAVADFLVDVGVAE